MANMRSHFIPILIIIVTSSILTTLLLHISKQAPYMCQFENVISMSECIHNNGDRNYPSYVNVVNNITLNNNRHETLNYICRLSEYCERRQDCVSSFILHLDLWCQTRRYVWSIIKSSWISPTPVYLYPFDDNARAYMYVSKVTKIFNIYKNFFYTDKMKNRKTLFRNHFFDFPLAK